MSLAKRAVATIYKGFSYRCLGSIRHLSSSTAGTQPSSENAADYADEPIWDMKNPYEREKQQCILCKHKVEVDYKNTRLLSQFVSSYTGKIYDKHITGLCAAQHDRVTRAILIARRAGLMPSYLKEVKYTKDPKLFDPFNPSRPNPY